jgi:hypothetical protein
MTKPPQHAGVSSDDPQAWLEGLIRATLDSALDCISTMDATVGIRRPHRGTIRAESEGLGKGAKFLIALPAIVPVE